MKKILCLIGFVLLLTNFCAAKTAAEILDEKYNEINDSNAGLAIPDEVKQSLNDYVDNEMTVENIAASLNAPKLLVFVFELFAKLFFKDFKLLVSLIVMLILMNILESVNQNKLSENNSLIKIIGTISLMTLMYSAIFSSMQETIAVIENVSAFTKTLMPVMIGLIVAQGDPAGAALYNSSLFTACQICSFIASGILMPMVNLYMAVIIASSISGNESIASIGGTIKKSITYIVGVVFTVFVGIMAFQSVLAAGADNLTKRTLKMAVGSLIPVAGGVLGEGMETLFSSVGVVKKTTGIYAVIVIVFIMLVPILSIISKIIMLKIAHLAANALNSKKIADMINEMSGVFSIMMTILIGIMLMMLTCVSIVIVSGG